MNSPAAVDYRCYCVTPQAPPSQVVSLARAAASGGAGIIQVRSKPISAADLYHLSQAVARAVAEVRPATRVVIDDRVDIAATLMAAGEHIHGAHIGQDDIPVPAARQLLGPQAIIGLTTGTLELVAAAQDYHHLLDYLGCGPFRATPTKDSGRPPLGLDGYPPLVAASSLPLVAIGDITVADSAALAATGVAGVALVRALANAEDPAAYASAVIAEFDRGVAARPESSGTLKEYQ